VELYLNPPILVYGVVLSERTGTDLPYLYLILLFCLLGPNILPLYTVVCVFQRIISIMIPSLSEEPYLSSRCIAA